MDRDALAIRLLETFLGELEEQLGTMNADLLALEATPGDDEHLRSLFRVAHTLKGAARAAGVPLIERACHAMETLLAAARDGKTALEPGCFPLLFSAADALEDARRRLVAGGDLAGCALEEVANALARTDRTGATTPVRPGAPAAVVPQLRDGDGVVRVHAEALDRLMASAGELLVAGGRSLERRADAEGIAEAAGRLSARWRRTARRARLALAHVPESAPTGRALQDAAEESRRLARDLDLLAGALAADARGLAGVSGNVLSRVRRLRMRPFSEACAALPRTVRDLAVGAGKEVELNVTGGEVHADSAVLDVLREVLLQLVRNAVDHGIEAPAERQRADKPPRGRVSVGAAIEGDRVVMTVADDGAGLNVQALRAHLERRGLPVPADERELVRSVFEPGVTTRLVVTTTSGRGVGLDIVRTAMTGIRGSVEVTWQPGRGTRFTLRCPPTIATIRALLVGVGSQVLALPSGDIERVTRITPGDVGRAEGRDVLVVAGRPVPLLSLAHLLSGLAARPLTGAIPAVVLRVGERRLAVAVDDLIGEQEVVLQPLGPGTRPLPLVSGAVLLSSGKIALVLDPGAVLAAGLAAAGRAGTALTAAEAPVKARSTVLVVDDSITTRTLEQSILEAAGYDVVAATDGADAWKALQERGADAVVADVDMPRMDGFALCEAIRGSKRFRRLPVVLVTALETPGHRERGLAVGADAYIGKSSFDQRHLVDTLAQLLGDDRP
jgi:two-component system chemotaxis sensor kinase CheA